MTSTQKRPLPTPAMVANGRVLGEPRLSPDGSLVAFVATVQGRGQIVVMAAKGGPEVVVTTEPEPPAAQAYGGGVFDWLPDGEVLVFAGKDGCLYSVPAGGGAAVLFASPVGTGSQLAAPFAAGRFVTCVQGGSSGDRVLLFDISPDGALTNAPPWPELVATADFCFDPTVNEAGDVAWHEWSVPDMAWDGGRICVRAMGPGAGDPIVGPRRAVVGGALVHVAGVHLGAAADSGAADSGGAESGGAEVVLANAGGAESGGAEVVRANAESVGQPRFSPDGARLAFTSDRSGWVNVMVASATLGPTGAAGYTEAGAVAPEAFEQADPAWGLGQRSYAWSPDGTRIAYQRNEGGFGRLVIAELATGALREISKGIHGGLSWRGERLACIRSGARTPTHVAVFDVPSAPPAGQPERRIVARGPVGGWEATGLVEPDVVHWHADDGAEVHGRLYRPHNVTLPPLLCWVHGGPTSQWSVAFRERFAYFVARGWAILVPDHRGSTGWGRAYTQAMRERWGDLDLHDTAAGIRHAVANGWCDPRRVVMMGGSAGGFTVLGVLGRYPELCAAGVDLFGVADLLQLTEVTHRFEAHYPISLVGPLPSAVARYREWSPVNFADQITAPLLILQGSADPVVPLSQSQAIADRLRALGRTVELHVYEGESHGWNRPTVVMDELQRTEDFLRRHVLQWRI